MELPPMKKAANKQASVSKPSWQTASTHLGFQASTLFPASPPSFTGLFLVL
jgi:hypothetical protein